MFSFRSVGVTNIRPVDGLYTTVIATCKRLPSELGVVVYQLARSSDAFSGLTRRVPEWVSWRQGSFHCLVGTKLWFLRDRERKHEYC